MSMKIPSNRQVERRGVASAKAFFESQNCIFNDIPLENDFGKDAYVDLVTGNTVTHLCAALQIKAGKSYRKPDGDYRIPLGKHALNWRGSTVPVFGIVFDEEDLQLRWRDLTGYLRDHPDLQSGSITIPKKCILNEHSFSKKFVPAVAHYAEEGQYSLATRLLGNAAQQSAGVYDAWLLGRKDAKYLILLRRILLDLSGESLLGAIRGLSHICGHPDIFFSADNSFAPCIQDKARLTFQWSPAEVAHLLAAVTLEDFGRGKIGQSLIMLLRADPDVSAVVKIALGKFTASGNMDTATLCAFLLLNFSLKPQVELEKLIQSYPALLDEAIFCEAATNVIEFGHLDLE